MHPPFRRRRRHCPVAKSTFTTYMDEGTIHFRAGHYRKALFCYDRALEIRSSDLQALIARSRCHLELGDAESALKDAESACDENYIHPNALLQYAESLYSLGLFEKALIAFHRGNRLRRDIAGFRLGIQKGQEAIRLAISDVSATQIEDLEDIIPLIKEMEQLKNRKQEHCCIRPDEEASRRKGAKLPPPSKARSRWVAREVLGSMYLDKDYLNLFLRRPDMKAENEATKGLLSHANEALHYLEIKEQFWRLRQPMYARKLGLNYNNNMVIQYEKQEKVRQEASRKIKMDAAEGAVLKNIACIEHSLKIGRAKDCQLECDRTIRQMKEIGVRLLPKKPSLLCQVLHYKGLALTKLKEFEKATDSFQTEYNVATENRISEIRARALNYLGKTNALRRQYGEAIEAWEGNLSLTKSPVERAYLYHELARCYMEITKPDIAKYYANLSIEEAVKIHDYVWAMNSYILLGQIDLKANDLESAAQHFALAQEHAVKCGNNANTQLLRETDYGLKVWIEKSKMVEEPNEHELRKAVRVKSQDSVSALANDIFLD